MDALWLGLSNLLQPAVMLALGTGAIGGLMIGAIPGIGPAIAIAILYDHCHYISLSLGIAIACLRDYRHCVSLS